MSVAVFMFAMKLQLCMAAAAMVGGLKDAQWVSISNWHRER
jgi:hypothetical protein